MQTGPGEVADGVPVRRARWPSLFVGAAALFASALAAAAFCGLLIWSPLRVDGAVVLILFGLFGGVGFFLSYQLRRRCARSLDARRPGIRFAGGVLTVPSADGLTSRFKLEEPHELVCGWTEFIVSAAGGPVTHTRGVLTHATLSQAGRQMFLYAEDSVREARAAGWPMKNAPPPSTPAVRLWAKDLVALVEAVRAHRR